MYNIIKDKIKQKEGQHATKPFKDFADLTYGVGS
jgi:hypothetical protein